MKTRVVKITVTAHVPVAIDEMDALAILEDLIEEGKLCAQAIVNIKTGISWYSDIRDFAEQSLSIDYSVDGCETLRTEETNES